MAQNKPLLTKSPKWTKSELEILKNFGTTSSKYELTKIIKRHSPIAISIRCRRLGLYKSKEFKSRQGKKARSSVKKMYTILDWKKSFEDLSYETQQILIGSLLGDGFISLNAGKSKEYCFRIGHGEAQKEYLIWKGGMLKELSPKLSGLELFTPTHPIFTQLRKSFYINNSTRKNNLINQTILNIDWLGFLIWYLDDGGLQSRNRDFIITSKLFDSNQLISLIKGINEKLGLNLTINSYKHKDGVMSRIRVPAIDRIKVYNKFKELFKIYNVPYCMQYKINIQPVKIETHKLKEVQKNDPR